MALGSWCIHPTRRRIMSSASLHHRNEPLQALDLSFHGSSSSNNNYQTPTTADDSDPESLRPLQPQQSSLKELLYSIRRNELTELRLGWSDQDCIFNASFPIRAARLLTRALQQNRSITRVSIGYRSLLSSKSLVGHQGGGRPNAQMTASTRRRQQVLIMILRALSKYLSQQITHLQMVLNNSLPEFILKQVLQSLSRLAVLELHAVRVECGAAAATRKTSNDKHSDDYTSTSNDDNNIVSRILIHCKLDQLQSLALIDCNLTDDKALVLAEYLHFRGGLRRLSLRNNRKIRARGWNMIAQAPIVDRLDASLCDMTSVELQAMARGLVKRPWPLKALWLNGNYRIDVPGLLAITSPACCEKLVALDLSYCDIGDYKARKTITNLQRMTPNAVLQQLTMHGSFVSGPQVSSELTLLLRGNTSLRVVRLNDPSKPKLFGVAQLECLLTSLRDNYDMEELRVDSSRSPDEEHILQEMDFFMRLNRAGRRMFRRPMLPALNASGPSQQQQRPPALQQEQYDEEWLRTLERAGDDLEVLFWLVKQSADRFGSNPGGRNNKRRRSRKLSTSSLLLFIRGRSDRALAAQR